jgi:tetratricopeptide (TPR) repeat protein
MIRRAICTGLLCLWVAVAASAREAAEVPAVARDPLEHALWTDLADGQIDEHSLLEAALIAGGLVDPMKLGRCRERFSELCRACVKPVQAASGSRARAIAAFHFMHKHALTGSYQANCWQLTQALCQGHYNCVTSSILYVCLCDYLGLDVVAMAGSSHVCCLLRSDPPLEVQTTCCTWFDQLNTPRILPSRQMRQIDNIQLIGKVYFNRGTALLGEQKYRSAVECLEAACLLDADDQPGRQNLLAALNNWALSLCDAGHHHRSSQLLLRGLDLAADHEELLANDVHIHQQWAIQLCQSGCFLEAAELLDRCHSRRGDVELFDVGRWSVYQTWAQSLLERGQVSEALAVFSQARRRHPECGELAACEASVWRCHMEQLTTQRRCAEAQRLRRQLHAAGRHLTCGEL